MVRERLSILLLALTSCNDMLGISDVSVQVDDTSPAHQEGPGPSPSSTSSTEPPNEDSGPPVNPDRDGGTDASTQLRQPDPACLKSTAPQNAVRRVELDSSPPPTSNGTTVSGIFSIYGDNAMTNVRLDFCTPDGPRTDVGGGFNYLGGSPRRWQTKTNVALPAGKVQAQVIADGNPGLKLVYDIELR